ncbi:hypothetical protein BpHYR1_029332 [Brachionus plicatilis]|uniref:Uncharacterized protein n=1 Tax=Brachionus plicatilis TaxID=10195 RepID=A0A3M7P5S7_BRAPC|nr:hypothetical protein BpHYR1_029332 [Brachionus plicatilis]
MLIAFINKAENNKSQRDNLRRVNKISMRNSSIIYLENIALSQIDQGLGYRVTFGFGLHAHEKPGQMDFRYVIILSDSNSLKNKLKTPLVRSPFEY